MHSPQDELLHWFTVRMFRTAALELHVHVLRYMVRQGFAVAMPALRGVAHEVVARSVAGARSPLPPLHRRAADTHPLLPLHKMPAACLKTCRCRLLHVARGTARRDKWPTSVPPPSGPFVPVPSSRSSSTTT